MRWSRNRSSRQRWPRYASALPLLAADANATPCSTYKTRNKPAVPYLPPRPANPSSPRNSSPVDNSGRKRSRIKRPRQGRRGWRS
jgi:hypothetical protein